ncbi:MAG: peptidase [Candidatus Saccharibacteria bacterium]|nr:peptidase [Candidatus Saccharibacteria bacterium]
MLKPKKLLLIIVILILGSLLLLFFIRERATAPSLTQVNKTAGQNTTPEQSTGFDKTKHSTSDPASIWVVSNKKRPLGADYKPEKIVTPNIRLRLGAGEEQMHVSNVMAPALEQMFSAEQKDGLNHKLSSGFRSYALQKQFYNNYVAQDGQEKADTYSARPGTSEHQTGLAADVIPASDKCHLEICFADLPEGKWVAEHAHEYGFIIRYQQGKEAITTYQFEPWHIRYVGTDLAQELHKSGLTMEEFFNLR